LESASNSEFLTMPLPDPDTLFDAARVSAGRTVMPTDLDTAGLRALGAGVLARGVFVARGTNAIFASELKRVIDELVSGRLSEGQARTALYELLDALGYDAEQGGFPGEEVPPALKGTLQDLRSFRRMDLIIRTQRDLMQGAGSLWRAMQPDSLAEFPALELVRMGEVRVPRDLPARWAIAGGKPAASGYAPNAHERLGEATGLIALVGDPVFGELGSYDNFSDALGVDHPPFFFSSGISWRLRSRAFCDANNITGPDGESIDEFHAGIERPRVMLGSLPLPTPRMSMEGVAPELVEEFKRDTRAEVVPGGRMQVDYSDLLEREIAQSNRAYAAQEVRR
jgi:polyhydroxyalkanoate synthesis regulator phasin